MRDIIVKGDGTCAPFLNSSFDIIITQSVLEHVPDKMAFLKEAYRELKPGGILYLSWIPSKTWFMDAHVPIGFLRYIFKSREAATGLYH